MPELHVSSIKHFVIMHDVPGILVVASIGMPRYVEEQESFSHGA
jgi:hypothetical protein